MRSPRVLASAALLVLALTATATGCVFGGDPVEVTVSSGTVRGEADDGVRAFRGIPYAAPPVGDLRWRAPQPVADWDETREATEFGAPCAQLAGVTPGLAEGSEEDCLYLNVWRPDTEQEDLPVMVWLHGGGLTVGNGNLTDQIVRGTVDEDVVVVSLNYRLGRLGYLAHPALADEQAASGEPEAGNFGLLDQVAGLEWVRDNIASFGGDPDQVTVFGISAGGASVNFLMSSPDADGLFARAITGSGLGVEKPLPYDDAAVQGESLLAGIGAPDDADAAALRELDVEDVVALPARQLRSEVPVLDAALPASVADTFAAGEEADVPWIVGTTDRELLDDAYVLLGADDPGGLRDRLVAGREGAAARAYGDQATFDAHFLNDIVFTEPARLLAAEHDQRAPTFLYRFSIASPTALETIGGAVHGSDYPYVFGDVDGDSSTPGSDELAAEVGACWTSFAVVGNPRCGGVTWPRADDGALVEFTNGGVQVLEEDPWAPRLDLVSDLLADNR